MLEQGVAAEGERVTVTTDANRPDAVEIWQSRGSQRAASVDTSASGQTGGVAGQEGQEALSPTSSAESENTSSADGAVGSSPGSPNGATTGSDSSDKTQSAGPDEGGGQATTADGDDGNSPADGDNDSQGTATSGDNDSQGTATSSAQQGGAPLELPDAGGSASDGTSGDGGGADNASSEADDADDSGAADKPEQEPKLAPEVDEVQPRLKLTGLSPDEAKQVAAELRGVDEVNQTAQLTVGETKVEGNDGVTTVSVAAVDVSSFRKLTPAVTADTVDVWRRVADGDAALLHKVADNIGADLGQKLPAGVDSGDGAAETKARQFAADKSSKRSARPEAEPERLRIGALASNGVPPVADSIVSRETADRLELEGDGVVLASVETDDPEAVANRVRESTGAEVEVLSEPKTKRAFLGDGATRAQFEPFDYVDLGDGMIRINPSWVRRNIATAQVPIFNGPVKCHRLIIPQLRGALQEVKDKGLAGEINPGQYAGCYVPRHILFNPARPLSMHAWGLALDFNVATNAYGATPQMDQRVVDIFQKWGFNWGGYWSTPDGMHFELGRLLENPNG
jgi:hypothetical protein